MKKELGHKGFEYMTALTDNNDALPRLRARVYTRGGFIRLFLLALIVLFGAILRHQRIGTDAISLDEMWHLGLSTGRGSPQMVWPADAMIHVGESWTDLAGAPPWYACWTHMERVLHPPAFVMTMRLWRDALGSGDVAAQWYTAAWSLLAIAMLFDFVKTLSRSAAAGLWAAAIMAVSPTQILLSQEVRAYTMLMGLTCCAMSAAARMETLGVSRRRAIGLGLSMLAMMLTHYFAIGICVIIAAWACIRFRGRQLAWLWMTFVAAGVVFAVVWAPIAIKQIPDISHTADPWLKEPAAHPHLLALGRFLSMPIRLLVDQDYAGLIWPAIGLALLCFVIVRITKRRELLLPILWFAGVCGFLLLLDWARTTRHLVHVRYSLAAGPAIAALAVMVWQSRGRASDNGCTGAPTGPLIHLAGGAIVVTLLLLNAKAHFADEPDYRVLRTFMVDRAAPGEPMLFYSGPAVKGYFNEILMLAASREPKLWPRDIVKMANAADPALIASLRGRTAWLFSGPVSDLPSLLPGCSVLEQQTLVDADDRPVAVCTHVKLPG